MSGGIHVDPTSPPTTPMATATALTLPAGPPGARPDGTLVPEVTTVLVPPSADDPDFWGVALRCGWAPTLRHQPAHRADTGQMLLPESARRELAALAATTTQPAATARRQLHVGHCAEAWGNRGCNPATWTGPQHEAHEWTVSNGQAAWCPGWPAVDWEQGSAPYTAIVPAPEVRGPSSIPGPNQAVASTTQVLPEAEPPTVAVPRADLLHEPHTGPRPFTDVIAPETPAGGAS